MYRQKDLSLSLSPLRFSCDVTMQGTRRVQRFQSRQILPDTPDVYVSSEMYLGHRRSSSPLRLFQNKREMGKRDRAPCNRVNDAPPVNPSSINTDLTIQRCVDKPTSYYQVGGRGIINRCELCVFGVVQDQNWIKWEREREREFRKERENDSRWEFFVIASLSMVVL